MNYEYELNKTFIPPWEKSDYVENRKVQVACTTISYVEVPANLTNDSEIIEYIYSHYTDSEILEDVDLHIEEVK